MDVLMMDVDGVMVRGRPGDGKPFATDLEHDRGLSLALWQKEFFKPHWAEIVTGRMPLTETLARVLARIAPDLGVETLLDYWFSMDAGLDNDLVASLVQYRTGGTKIFLATNQEHRRAAYLMKDLGLADHVDGIIYSAELGYRKPDPEFFRLATLRAGVDPARIVLVDDTLENVEGARRFGWQAIHWTGQSTLADALSRR